MDVPNTGDLGVVRLELGPPIVLPEYGRLPASGYLDSFSTQKGQQDLDVTSSATACSRSSALHSSG